MREENEMILSAGGPAPYAALMSCKMRSVVSCKSRENDLAEELNAHIEMLAEENIRRGVPPGEAHRRAKLSVWQRRIDEGALLHTRLFSGRGGGGVSPDAGWEVGKRLWMTCCGVRTHRRRFLRS